MTISELINDTTIPFEARKIKLTKLLRAKKLTEDEEWDENAYKQH